MLIDRIKEHLKSKPPMMIKQIALDLGIKYHSIHTAIAQSRAYHGSRDFRIARRDKQCIFYTLGPEPDAELVPERPLSIVDLNILYLLFRGAKTHKEITENLGFTTKYIQHRVLRLKMKNLVERSQGRPSSPNLHHSVVLWQLTAAGRTAARKAFNLPDQDTAAGQESPCNSNLSQLQSTSASSS